MAAFRIKRLLDFSQQIKLYAQSSTRGPLKVTFHLMKEWEMGDSRLSETNVKLRQKRDLKWYFISFPCLASVLSVRGQCTRVRLHFVDWTWPLFWYLKVVATLGSERCHPCRCFKIQVSVWSLNCEQSLDQDCQTTEHDKPANKGKVLSLLDRFLKSRSYSLPTEKGLQ